LYSHNATNLRHLTTHSTTVLTYKMAIVLRPQICDVISPYVYSVNCPSLKFRNVMMTILHDGEIISARRSEAWRAGLVTRHVGHRSVLRMLRLRLLLLLLLGARWWRRLVVPSDEKRIDCRRRRAGPLPVAWLATVRSHSSQRNRPMNADE